MGDDSGLGTGKEKLASVADAVPDGGSDPAKHDGSIWGYSSQKKTLFADDDPGLRRVKEARNRLTS